MFYLLSQALCICDTTIYGLKDRINGFDQAPVFYSLSYEVRGKFMAKRQYQGAGDE